MAAMRKRPIGALFVSGKEKGASPETPSHRGHGPLLPQ